MVLMSIVLLPLVPSTFENADVLAKRAIQLPPDNHNALPLQDYIPSIRHSIRA